MKFDLNYIDRDDLSDGVIYIDFPYVEGIKVYEYIKGQEFYEEIQASRNIVKTYFKLSSNFDSSRPVYIYLENPEEGMRINFSDNNDFFRIQNFEIVFISVVLGFVLAFTLINLVLYASTGDSIYVWHAVYVLAMMVTMYLNSGMRFFLTGKKISSFLMNIIEMTTVMLSMNFTYRYLTFGKKSRIMEQVYTLISFFFILISVIMVVSLNQSAYIAFELLIMLAYFIIIMSALIFYYRYDHVSIYYLCGTLLLEFALMINGASRIGWTDSSIIIRIFYYTAIGLEACFSRWVS